ncbi:hypothetical protein pEaSNUABM22_00037 [Erwinia phage pEa_SNUABM_22]|uniref:Uncharacterized protein n=1 Tax=Erwinia phage pEa_SNUABM_22 TaxID=2869549 RepID=A0AAE8XQ55_9CAUD|nr:hypothetical protein MPK63_gp037 [Erwinia phage pEa_SNUABM_22]UAW96525.1 hypothetical protein pEaSNUABM22_00037 [Erwinia phage pEa_SNUABM_22]
MLIDFLKAVPAIILCYIIWRYVTNKVERDRHLRKAQEHYNHGRLDSGNVWIHLKTGRPYTVLCLTNTGVNKSNWRNAWEINVVYTNDFEQVWNRPFSEFCHKFTHVSRGPNEEHFTTTLMGMQMEANTRILIPHEGEMWFEGTVHATPPELVAQGHAPQVVSQRRAHIDMVLGVGQAHPVVVYTVNDKQTAMLLSQFIFIYRKEASFDGTVSSSV